MYVQRHRSKAEHYIFISKVGALPFAFIQLHACKIGTLSGDNMILLPKVLTTVSIVRIFRCIYQLILHYLSLHVHFVFRSNPDYVDVECEFSDLPVFLQIYFASPSALAQSYLNVPLYNFI